MVNQREGVLVLSENAGCHEQLGRWAFSINPFDVEATAAALFRALTMDQRQRRARLNRIRDSVRQNDIATWISAQLQDIRDLTARRWTRGRIPACPGRRARSRAVTRRPGAPAQKARAKRDERLPVGEDGVANVGAGGGRLGGGHAQGQG